MMQPRTTFAAKSVILVLLIFLWVASGTFIFIGSYTLHAAGDMSHVAKSSLIFVPAVLCLSVGVLLFIVGLMGCFACTMDNRPLLVLFVAVMVFVFLGQITVATLGIVYRTKVDANVEKALKKEISNYTDDSSFSHEVDFIQSYYECCGVRNYSDWYQTVWFEQYGVLPGSCCKGGNCTKTPRTTSAAPPITTPATTTKPLLRAPSASPGGVFKSFMAGVEKVVDKLEDSVQGLFQLAAATTTAAPPPPLALAVKVIAPVIKSSQAPPAVATTTPVTMMTTVAPTPLPNGAVFPDPCLTKLETSLERNFGWLASLAVLFVVFEIMGLVAACLIIRRGSEVHYEQFGIATEGLNI